MGFFDKIRSGLQKTQQRLVHELKRIVTLSPKLTSDVLGDIEAALMGADFGLATTQQIVGAVRQAYESQGRGGEDVLEVARREVERVFEGNVAGLEPRGGEVTVVSIVGVNGTGKTTTTAKLAHWMRGGGRTSVIAACDTFRAAAIEQLKLWGQRLDVPVVAGAYGADAAAVGHDAVTAARARKADFLLVDTAGRLHTKHNLMQELQKLHRVIGKQCPGAPHEVLLVLDATTGMNALSQAREFHKAVPLTGLVITKLDGTSKGGMVVAIRKELGLPVRFIGVGEQADDLQPFDAGAFAAALFAE
ncbi:MAG: signal recognition particle-docking protein FtsY [Verrucomicrobiae bacterium]|nr:signal recognition particle-docking protein FtsY [Verrucomicrobiae bacterium]